MYAQEVVKFVQSFILVVIAQRQVGSCSRLPVVVFVTPRLHWYICECIEAFEPHLHVGALFADVQVFDSLVYEESLFRGEGVDIRAPSVVGEIPAVAIYRSLEVACGKLVGKVFPHSLTCYWQLSLHVDDVLAEVQFRIL